MANEESSNIVSSAVPIESAPDVESLTPEQCQAEWQGTMADSSYTDRAVFSPQWDHTKRVARMEKLFERGYSEKLKKEKEAREEASQKSIDDQLEKTEEEEILRGLAKAKQGAEFYFGSEGKAEKAISVAQDVLTEIGSEADLEFLDSTGLGNSPQIIQMLVNFSDHPELYADLKKIGIKNLIRIGDVALRRKK